MGPTSRTEYLDVFIYASNNFAERFENASVAIQWLELHKYELESASKDLTGHARAAAKDLLMLIDRKAEPGQNVGTYAQLIRHDLKTIANSVSQEPSVEHKEAVKPASGWWNRWLPIIVNITGVLVGTSTGVMGRVFAASQAGQSPNTSSPLPVQGTPQVMVILHLLQTAIIVFFIWEHRNWLKDLHSRITDATPIAKRTLEQFTGGWLFMWYGWLALYAWFSFAAIQSWRGYASPSIESISDFFDVVSGFALWWCYFVLDIPSVKTTGKPRRDEDFWHAAWFAGVLGLLCVAIAILDRRYQWGYFGVCLVGLYNALGLACLTGRFGSHYMGLRRWMILFLYGYAMLQIFYSFLPMLQKNTPMWTPSIYILALILKMVLALAGAEMLKNGGLRRYLEAAQCGLLEVSNMTPERWAKIKKTAESTTSATALQEA